jgi:hypothetical protein
MIDLSCCGFAVSVKLRTNLREYAVSYKRKTYIQKTKIQADSESTSRNEYKHYRSEDQ